MDTALPRSIPIRRIEKMTIYHVLHFNKDVCDGVKDVGYYSSKAEVQKAIVFLRTRLGFCDVPDGFVIQRCELDRAEELPEVVYEAMAYYHTEYYEFEHNIPLGVFIHEAEARKRIDQFVEDNPTEVSGVERDLIVNRCVLNRIEWADGYVTEYFED